MPQHAPAHTPLVLQGLQLLRRASVELLDLRPRPTRHADPEVPRAMELEVLRHDVAALGPAE
eukprot:13530261-Alexandrium_andersonii.AAC.1